MTLNEVTDPALAVGASVAFYKRLGRTLIVSSPHYARFTCPADDATFSVQLVDAVQPSSSTLVYFETASLDETVKQLQRDHMAFVQQSRGEPWLWREALIAEPAGNVICLYWAGVNRLNRPWRIGS